MFRKIGLQFLIYLSLSFLILSFAVGRIFGQETSARQQNDTANRTFRIHILQESDLHDTIFKKEKNGLLISLGKNFNNPINRLHPKVYPVSINNSFENKNSFIVTGAILL